MFQKEAEGNEVHRRKCKHVNGAAGLSQVDDGLHRIDTVVTGTSMPLALYLVEGVGPVEAVDQPVRPEQPGTQAGWLVTDTGCVGNIDALVLPALQQLQPGAVIDTGVICHAHADHFGGNAELLAANPACRLYAHENDVAWASDPDLHLSEYYDWLELEYPTPAAAKTWVASLLGSPTPVTALVSGDRFPLANGGQLSVVPLPGHSAGHIGLWNAERGVLLASDAILGDGQWAGGKLDAIPSYLDVAAYLGTISTIRHLGVKVLCTAHFPVMRGSRVTAFCDLSEAFVRRLDGAVRAALRGDMTLRELTGEVVPVAAPGVEPSVTAAFSVHAHLEALVARGFARMGMRGRERVWSRA